MSTILHLDLLWFSIIVFIVAKRRFLDKDGALYLSVGIIINIENVVSDTLA